MTIDPQKPSILLVDDEVLNLKLLSTILMPSYGVLTAMTGQDALRMLAQLAQADQVDNLVVLLDILMPEMDGFAVLAEIRERYPDIPVLMCTAVNTHKDVMQALNLGAVDYILKPFQMKTVRDKVAKAVVRTAAQRMLS
jgi:putative two-component system response regulator